MKRYHLLLNLLGILAFTSAFAMNGGKIACYSPDECEHNFPESVYVLRRGFFDQNCTATKISSHHFLTARHCAGFANFQNSIEVSIEIGIVALNRNTHSLTIEDYEQDKTINTRMSAEHFLSNNYTHSFSAHISKWHFPARKSVDVAIFELAEETPEIPIASLCFEAMTEGQEVYVTGFGKQTSVNDRSDGEQGVSLRYAKTLVMRTDPKSGTFRLPGRGGLFVVHAEITSLLPGDSGGAVFKEDHGTKCVVGINSAILVYPFHDFAFESEEASLSRGRYFDTGRWIKDVLSFAVSHK